MVDSAQNSNTDVFDELMDGELDDSEIQEEENPDDSGSQKTPKDDPVDDSGEEEEVTVDSLQGKIADLTTESKGRYKEIKKLRTAKQELEDRVTNLSGRIDQISDLFSKSQTKRQDEGSEDSEEEVNFKGIPVSFDEDGNPFIDEKHLKTLKVEDTDTKKKVEDIELKDKIRTLQSDNEKEIVSVLETDDEYPEAYKRLNTAYKFLDTKIGEILEDQDLTVEDLQKSPDPMSAALDLIESDKAVMKEFISKFPGVDPETIIEGKTRTQNGVVNKRKLKKALNALRKEPDPGEDKGKNKDKTNLKNLKFISKKASNLSGVRNQKGHSEVSLDDLAGIKADDFLNLSEESVNQLEKLLYEQELEEYS